MKQPQSAVPTEPVTRDLSAPPRDVGGTLTPEREKFIRENLHILSPSNTWLLHALDEMREENAKLREALAPFAALARLPNGVVVRYDRHDPVVYAAVAALGSAPMPESERSP